MITMFTIPRIQQLVLHPELVVQSFARHTLQGIHHPHRPRAIDVWRLFDEGGSTPDPDRFYTLGRLNQCVESVRRGVRAIVEVGGEHTRNGLRDIYWDVPIEHTSELLEVARGTERLPKEIGTRLEKRLALAKCEPLDLWQQLMRHAASGGDDWPEAKHRDDLIDALTPHPSLAPMALTLIEPGDEDWPQIFAMELLARWRTPEAAEMALDYLLDDDIGDFMFEACLEYVRRIGSIELARQMSDRYDEAPFSFQLATHNILASLHSPEAASILRGLIERQDDDSDSVCILLATILRMGVDDDALFDRAIMFVNEYQGIEVNDLRDVVAGFALATGSDRPGVEKVIRAAKKVEYSITKSTRRLDRLLEAQPPAPKYDPRASASEGSVADSTEVITYVRAEPKVGRNDPCPCGSGKKYKKCCGK